MQITFTGIDGKEITVTDPRRSASAAAAALPTPRRPTGWTVSSWLISTMIAAPEPRRPASSILGSWIVGTMKV
jgi:hypothetical protein